MNVVVLSVVRKLLVVDDVCLSSRDPVDSYSLH